MTQDLHSSVRKQIRVETRFWETDPFERPGTASLENFLNKATDAAIFHEISSEFASVFASAHTVLELGGGRGRPARGWTHQHHRHFGMRWIERA